MRISGNFCQPVNPLLANAPRINNALQGRNVAANGGQNRDRVSISPQGKAASLIERINERKEAITERKNALIGETLESGADLKTIEGQLAHFDEQLGELDKQVEQITSSLVQQAAEQAEQKKAKADEDETKTDEQRQTEKLSRLANITDSVQQAETVASVRERFAGEARVEQAEIGSEDLRIEQLSDKAGDGTNVRKMVENAKRELGEKQESLDGMHLRIDELSLMEGGALREATELLEEEQSTSNSMQPDEASTQSDEPTNG